MHDTVHQEVQKKTIVEHSAKTGVPLLQGRVLSSPWRVGERIGELENWKNCERELENWEGVGERIGELQREKEGVLGCTVEGRAVHLTARWQNYDIQSSNFKRSATENYFLLYSLNFEQEVGARLNN